MGHSFRWTRGWFVAAAIALLLAPYPTIAARSPAVPVIHVTDLHRPHVDPDDHWDLACVYALAYRGDIELKGIVIDYPPARGKGHNPDIAAVAQMNRITNLAVPVAVGTPHAMRSPHDAQPYASPSDHQGINMVMDILRDCDRRVVIHITGNSRDIAVAGAKRPDLFAKKCAGIYLNAGTGASEKSPGAKLEYNVTLGRTAYDAIFDLPCPVYWMPCFETLDAEVRLRVQAFGTYYRFSQGDILPHLSNRVRNYFAYMFARQTDHNWLGYLEGKPDEALVAKVAEENRNMWCTAGFLHAAGYSITVDGKISRRALSPAGAVFSFDPIRITRSELGTTEWTSDPGATQRFVFHARDRENYGPAVTEAMRSLLMELP